LGNSLRAATAEQRQRKKFSIFMTKVLFILSFVVMMVASVFAWQNGRAFTEERNAKASLHRQIKTELTALTKMADDVKQMNASVASVGQEVETQNEKLKTVKLTITQTDAETKRTEDDLKDKSTKMEELNQQLNKLPPGFNPQTIAEDLNKIKAEIAELHNQADAKKKEMADAEKKTVDAEKALDDVTAKIEARKKSFERNSMSFTVVAVNSDWGFVVIDGGEKEGITPDTKLLVIRGTKTVGKLSILAVQGGKTIANVLTESLAPGMTPAPGDKVILENLYQ
jgi:septal ring factor EnvC (AmiA/AmiB activator)